MDNDFPNDFFRKIFVKIFVVCKGLYYCSAIKRFTVFHEYMCTTLQAVGMRPDNEILSNLGDKVYKLHCSEL